MAPNKKLLAAAVARHKSVAENPADLAFLKAKQVRKRAGEVEQAINGIFLSKLPESVADNSSTGELPKFGRMISRVYDGDMCRTRDEAY